jgi:hypothetical protein
MFSKIGRWNVNRADWVIIRVVLAIGTSGLLSLALVKLKHNYHSMDVGVFNIV